MNNEIQTIQKLLEKHNYIEAEKQAALLTNRFPKNSGSFQALGICQMSQYKDTQAIKSFQKGLKIDPNDFGLNHNISLVYFRNDLIKKALTHNQTSIESSPEHPLPYLSRGMINMKKRLFQEAQNDFEKAINIFGGFNNTNDNLLKTQYMESLIANNQEEKIIEIYQQLKSQDKFDPDVFYLLASNKPDFFQQDEIEKILKLKNQNFQNSHEKVNVLSSIYFGIGKIYEKKKNTEFENIYIEGNNIIKNFQRFNMFNLQKKILDSINKFKKINYKNENSLGENIIFILGMPRTGTTLLESIIASNKNVFSGGEMVLMTNLIEDYVLKNDAPNIEGLKNIGQQYIDRISEITRLKIFIDKMPDNFFYLGYILYALPKAKIIHIERDPWDNAISLFKQRYIRNIHYSSSFFNIALQIANHDALKEFWHSSLPSNLKTQVFSVSYEELVSNPDEMKTKIIEFCEIDEIENSSKRENFFSRTASMSQVRGEIHQKSLKKRDFSEFYEQFQDAYNNQKEYWNNKI